ncbi:GspH/FimT family pseudopilin [Rhodanobacter sp. OK091]|uniref:pilus assembly FimT family protein n=1 Tax=Rhodanobacter sp. OK091 TaxID=1881037 RepID=UPI00091B46C6|nr:GspH/FimT family pseudopilin [Rhodanobacter sp. OK091]SHM06046.1 type IV fimbrial biogenesis protein FimT [Rhodanobacter sp. OK091]
MQVLSRQRGVSLIEVRKSANTGSRLFECGSIATVASRHKPVAARRHASGFTMVELMITVTIAVVLIMIAVPSFKTIILSNKLTTTSNDLILAINSARMEAVKRNAKTQLCSNSASVNTSDTLGNACTTQTGAVYVLVGGSPATAATVLAGITGITMPIQLSGNVQALRFNGQGLAYAATATAPYNGTVADICTSQMSNNNHRKITMVAGSILATAPAPDSRACP